MTRNPSPRSSRKDVRQAVLDAAMELADTQGPTQLTLQAGAARAGVSKGGLLHHFASKEALLEAMVGEITDGFERGLHGLATQGDGDPRFLARTHVKQSFAGSGRSKRGGMALLAVATLQPELLAPLRSYLHRRTTTVARFASRPAEALAAMLIADAVHLFDAPGIPPLSGARRTEVLAGALRLLNGSPSSAVANPVAAPSLHDLQSG